MWPFTILCHLFQVSSWIWYNYCMCNYLQCDFVPKVKLSKRGTFVSPLEPLRRQCSAEQLECLKTCRWLPCLHILLGRRRPVLIPRSAFHSGCGIQQPGSGHAIVFPITKQNLPNTAAAILQPLSLSLTRFPSLSLTALQRCSGNPDSNLTHFFAFLAWWSEMNRTRVSVPTKTNSKLKRFQVKLPLCMTK